VGGGPIILGVRRRDRNPDLWYVIPATGCELARCTTVGGVTSLAELQAGDPQRIGPYVLVGRLGSGGMGRVYLARSPGGRQVAVKVIRSELADDAGFRTRFAREVAAARKVGGLFTAQVVDADLESPVPWLVTAFVPGMSLAEAVDHEGPLPPGTVLALAAGLSSTET
jgi:serine/threonine protein kinase